MIVLLIMYWLTGESNESPDWRKACSRHSVGTRMLAGESRCRATYRGIRLITSGGAVVVC